MEIEKKASRIPLEIVEKAKLLRVKTKSIHLNDMLYLILGSQYHEVYAGAEFHFSMGEKVIIAQVIECAKGDENEQLSTPIDHDIAYIVTPTFLGNIYGTIDIGSSVPLISIGPHKSKMVAQKRPKNIVKTTEVSQEYICGNNIEKMLKDSFLSKLTHLLNEFISKSDERQFMEKCGTDIKKYIESVDVIIHLPEDFIETISLSGVLNAKGNVLCYCLAVSKRKKVEITAYFNANSKVKKMFFGGKKVTAEDVSNCWSFINLNRHLSLHNSKPTLDKYFL